MFCICFKKKTTYSVFLGQLKESVYKHERYLREEKYKRGLFLSTRNQSTADYVYLNHKAIKYKVV